MQEIIQNLAIETLIPYENNYLDHTNNVNEITNSIKDFDFTTPIEVDENNIILAGHGRLQAAKSLGMTNIPFVLKISGWDEKKKAAYRFANNTSALKADVNYEMVDKELAFIGDEFDIEDYGFEMHKKSGIIEDTAPDAPVTPKTVRGDIYQLGEHRVMCGDSTVMEEVERLMNGKLADMIHTDPPYNVDYGISKIGVTRSIENDKQDPEHWEAFCKDLYEVFRRFNKGDIYMWGAPGPEGMKMRLWLVEAGCHWSTTIIWKKDRLVLTPANYQRMYEPCFYGWFDKSSFEADRKEVEVWDIKRPSDSKLPPTMKPIELCAKAITNSSKFRDTVLDLFLGSGSTLIAAEQVGRTCYGMEYEPKYCDVIVQRWVNMTGGKVILNGQEIDWAKS